MKRILAQGYVKLIDSTGTDTILIETLKDLNPSLRDKKFIIQQAFRDETKNAFEHYQFTFKFKIPISLLQHFRWYKNATITEIPEYELDGYIPPTFQANGIPADIKQNIELQTKFRNFYSNCFNFFSKLNTQNIEPQHLEYLLPLGMFTTFYFTMDLNDLMLFLNVNLKSGIPEIKEIAQAMVEYFKVEYPLTSSIFLKFRFGNGI